MLKALYSKQDEIPETFRELYSERDGKWELTGVDGMHTQATVDRLEGALARAKSEREEAKKALADRGEATPVRVQELTDEVEELKTKLEMAGKTPEDFETKLSELADRRATSKVAPVQRELDEAKKKIGELEGANGELLVTVNNRDIDDVLRSAASKHKVVQTAVPDVLMHRGLFEKDESGAIVGRDGVGITPGISPEQWLQDMQKTRGHWWAPSQGGGATGGGPNGGIGDNPWSAKNWNLTKQGEFVKENGVEKAKEMAKLAGSQLGATSPPSSGS